MYYYSNSTTLKDYWAIGGTSPFASASISGTASDYTSLYNGNIAAMGVNLPKVGGAMLYTYRYDQLNRIVSMTPFKGITAVNAWTGTATQDYKESGIAYDPSGNILTYTRNGSAAAGTALQMDQLTYKYYYYTSGGARKQYDPRNGIPSDAARLTNQLAAVKDVVNKDNYTKWDGTEDVDNQPDSNYTYDAIGNMIANKGDSVLEVGWNVYGKISYLTKSVNGVNQTIVYKYDASGNRISKSVGNGKTTYYVRDAQGNVLSTYERKDTLRQTEVHLYGSSRLGVLQVKKDVQDCQPPAVPDSISFIRGWKQYELSNHLSNVLATISDRHYGVDTNSNNVTDYYLAEVITEQDYYPFGMQMPGRKYPVPEPLPLAGAGSPSSPIELYRHGFKTHVTPSSLVYSAAPNTLSSYLDSSKWTLSIPGYPSSYFLSYASPVTSGPSQDSALGFATTPIGVVSSMTLTFQVKPGYRLTLTSFSFYNRSTADPSTGYKNWRMTINGTEVGADTLQRQSVPLLSTGTLAIAGPMSALTGTVTVVLYFSNSVGGTGTVRIDNFVLNGFVQQIPNSGNAPITSADGKGYRFGFNGKEYDNEVYGEGNEQDYGMRIYDPRVGKFLSVDPLTSKYPELTPYQFAANMPISFIDLDGEETGLDQITQRREEAYLKGEISEDRYRQNIRAMGVAGTIGTVVVLDIYVTKGKVSQFLLYTQLGGHLYHNRSPNEEVNKQRNREFYLDLLAISAGYSFGRMLETGGAIAFESQGVRVALGKNFKTPGVPQTSLQGFAANNKAVSFHDWPSKIPGFGSYQRFPSFEEAFKYATDAAVSSGGKIVFNLDAVNIKFVQSLKRNVGCYEALPELNGKSLWESNMTTEWEYLQIMNNPSLKAITEFRHMGSNVPAPGANASGAAAGSSNEKQKRKSKGKKE